MKSMFDESTFNEVQERFSKLGPDSESLWGKMSVGQMLWHCQVFVKDAIKNKKYTKKRNPILRWFFKKSMYNDKLWRKNLPTTRFAKAKEEKDFELEYNRLQELIKELYSVRERKNWNPHPVFGDFTPKQWGQLEYKHLDHHLRQFGV